MCGAWVVGVAGRARVDRLPPLPHARGAPTSLCPPPRPSGCIVARGAGGDVLCALPRLGALCVRRLPGQRGAGGGERAHEPGARVRAFVCVCTRVVVCVGGGQAPGGGERAHKMGVRSHSYSRPPPCTRSQIRHAANKLRALILPSGPSMNDADWMRSNRRAQRPGGGGGGVGGGPSPLHVRAGGRVVEGRCVHHRRELPCREPPSATKHALAHTHTRTPRAHTPTRAGAAAAAAPAPACARRAPAAACAGREGGGRRAPLRPLPLPPLPGGVLCMLPSPTPLAFPSHAIFEPYETLTNL